jgi:hypothetical protein
VVAWCGDGGLVGWWGVVAWLGEVGHGVGWVGRNSNGVVVGLGGTVMGLGGVNGVGWSGCGVWWSDDEW